MSLFNDYRPLKMSDVLGQEAAVETIKAQLKSGDVPQVNLFYGCHGCGKTTMARILARAVNCEHPSEDGEPCGVCEACTSKDAGGDIVEIDAAANNGVADVDRMVRLLQYQPYHNKRVVILDEVHNLSKAAFDHLLKPIEEPPKDVIFIFCTTEEKKVPATILSRCVNKIAFKEVDDAIISERIKEICETEGISITEGGLGLLVKEARGSMRDALSALEQVSYGGEITEAKVRSAFSSSSDLQAVGFLKALATEPLSVSCGGLYSLLDGANVAVFLQGLLSVLLDLLSIRQGLDVMHLTASGRPSAASKEYLSALPELTELFGDAEINRLLSLIAKLVMSNPRNLSVYSIICVMIEYMEGAGQAQVTKPIPHTEPTVAVKEPVAAPSEPKEQPAAKDVTVPEAMIPGVIMKGEDVASSDPFEQVIDFDITTEPDEDDKDLYGFATSVRL